MKKDISKQNGKSDLLDALEEVLGDVRGEKMLSARVVNVDEIDVYAIRQKSHLTQLEFSRRFGFSLRTLQQWEQGKRRPHGSAKVLLRVIDSAPDAVEKALRH